MNGLTFPLESFARFYSNFENDIDQYKTKYLKGIVGALLITKYLWFILQKILFFQKIAPIVQKD